jgi:hypothetical protein
VKSVVLSLALLTGCGFAQRHPITTIAIANSALVVGSGVCAVECDGDIRRASDGVLIGELALSSLVTAVVIETVAVFSQSKF